MYAIPGHRLYDQRIPGQLLFRDFLIQFFILVCSYRLFHINDFGIILGRVGCKFFIQKEGIYMEGIKSILIKDTTREERIRIVNKSLEVCGQECQFCNGCDNIGGGRTETFFQPYIDGEKELREINAEYIAGRVKG